MRRFPKLGRAGSNPRTALAAQRILLSFVAFGLFREGAGNNGSPGMTGDTCRRWSPNTNLRFKRSSMIAKSVQRSALTYLSDLASQRKGINVAFVALTTS